MAKAFPCAGLVALMLAQAIPGWAQATLEAVAERQALRCGVTEGNPGLAVRAGDGTWQGFDADICRAVAAAALGEDARVEFVPLDDATAHDALAAGRVDLLARGRFLRQTAGQIPVRFVTFTFVDAQSFLVPSESRVRNALQLDGARICLREGTTAEDNLASFGRSAKLRFEAVVLAPSEPLSAALKEGRCAAVSAGRLELAAVRLAMAGRAAEFEILPEVLSRDQTGPFVRDGDQAWFNLVKWTVFALIQAEELSPARNSVESLRATSKDPRIRRFLGLEGGLGAALGVGDDWVFQVIKAVGNYGEIYDRHLGPDTPLGLERGPNALWNEGGLLHAMPFQ